MKKFVLGAGAALAFWNSVTQAQTPAPIVPASSDVGMTTTLPPTMEGTPTYGATESLAGPGGWGGSVGYGASPTNARFYTEASYLLMYVSDVSVPDPLLTNGLAGSSGTRVFAGNNDTEYDTMSGFKVSVGGLAGGNSVGLEANAMFLGRTNDTQTFRSTGSSFFARPFFDTTFNAQNAKVIASPGAFEGNFVVNHNVSAWGAELNPFYRLVQGNTASFDIITGFRFFSVNEAMNLYDSTRVLAGGTSAFNGVGLGAGSVVLTHDKFSVRNNFYGGNIGGRVSFSRGSFFVDATGKIAVGGVSQQVNVDGSTTLAGGAGLVAPTTTGGGFLANPAFTGNRNENRFAVLPEGNITLGYQVSSWLNVFAGYQVLYFSNVARPQEQLDRRFASSNVPTIPTYSSRGLTSRNVDIVSSDIYLHGFSFGFTLNY